MSAWGFYFDQTRCIGCKTCTVACMAWNEGKRGDAGLYPEREIEKNPAYETPAGYETTPDGSFNHFEMSKYHMKEELIRVTETEYGRGMPDVDILYLALSCGHCAKPACAAVCPRGCIKKDEETGAVLVENSGCAGCGNCLHACPFSAPQFYTGTSRAKAPIEEKAIDSSHVASVSAKAPESPAINCKTANTAIVPMVKCDLCIERIRVGLKPACVAACRARALDAAPLDALAARYPGAKRETVDLPTDISESTKKHTCPSWLFKPRTPRL